MSDWTAEYAIGAWVMIVGDHPWSGHCGQVEKHERLRWNAAKPSLVVALENGRRAGVTRSGDLKLFNPNPSDRERDAWDGQFETAEW